MTPSEFYNALRTLKRDASAVLAQYPQYKGHFDNYVLVRVTKRIKTKGGVAFEAGDVSIANPNTTVCESGRYKGRRFVTVWSARRMVDTSIKCQDVQFL